MTNEHHNVKSITCSNIYLSYIFIFFIIYLDAANHGDTTPSEAGWPTPQMSWHVRQVIDQVNHHTDLCTEHFELSCFWCWQCVDFFVYCITVKSWLFKNTILPEISGIQAFVALCIISFQISQIYLLVFSLNQFHKYIFWYSH